MNPVIANPDMKINMSLDEIIHFTRGEINNQLQWRHLRGIRKRKKYIRKRPDVVGCDHSVPLMGRTTGVDIYVSNHSPLLSVENRRRLVQAYSNRAINSTLIEKTKEIIPAEYKLVKTTNGVERILVPVINNHFRALHRKKPLRPRKLGKDVEKTNETSVSLADKPPPLVTAPIYHPTKMEVDSSSDEIVVLDTPNPKKLEVIDITSDLGDDVIQAKKLCMSSSVASSMPQMTTLNDRFTMLCGSFQF